MSKQVERTCHLCDGNGTLNLDPPCYSCPSCNGTGVVMETGNKVQCYFCAGEGEYNDGEGGSFCCSRCNGEGEIDEE